MALTPQEISQQVARISKIKLEVAAFEHMGFNDVDAVIAASCFKVGRYVVVFVTTRVRLSFGVRNRTWVVTRNPNIRFFQAVPVGRSESGEVVTELSECPRWFASSDAAFERILAEETIARDVAADVNQSFCKRVLAGAYSQEVTA
jgi:hypothetical protein